jgi:hypothetical protein
MGCKTGNITEAVSMNYYNLRIPAKKTTHSGPKRPPIPEHEDQVVPSSALVV